MGDLVDLMRDRSKERSYLVFARRDPEFVKLPKGVIAMWGTLDALFQIQDLELPFRS